MTACARWVFPADTQLLSAELVERNRADSNACTSDVAVYRPGARRPIRVLGAREAALVNCFRHPATIAEAMIAYCADHGGDPRTVLLEAHEFLEALAQDGIIVRAESLQANPVEPILPAGQRADGFSVTRRVSWALDTEVYEARTTNGTPCAIKIGRDPSATEVVELLHREAAILELLDGAVSPSLLAVGTLRERPYVALSWHSGASPAAASMSLGGAAGRTQLVRTARRVLAAYAVLEQRGVVHGDVHPGNVIVRHDGRVTLIDFGFARLLGHERWGVAPRAGVPSYREPEFAAALLANTPATQATQASDQYSLAALLFRMLTGTTYLHFAADEDVLHRQIMEDEPRSFSDCGTVAWPQVESVLRRALRKLPEERYASRRDFVDAFATATTSSPPQASRVTAPAFSRRSPPFVANVAKRLLRNDNVDPSSTTATGGAAGTAFALYRLACATDDSTLLAAADIWSTRALRSLTTVGPVAIGAVTPLATRLPLLHSGLGVHLVNAHVQSALQNHRALRDSVDAFVRNSSQAFSSSDVMFGRAGALLALSLLASVPDVAEDAGQRGRLIELGRGISRSIEQTCDTLAPIGACSELANLGIAHGWAGLLYATLIWCRTNGVIPAHWVARRLRELAACAVPTPRGARWQWRDRLSDRDGRPAYMPGWCNGSAGFVHLWLAASTLLKEPAFEQLATRAAWDTWEHETPAWDLCCGSAGRAYALLAFYRHTGERAWLERASRLTARAIDRAEAAPADVDRPWQSLTRGSAGVAVLAAELATVDDARMPLFEAERWQGRAPQRVDA